MVTNETEPAWSPAPGSWLSVALAWSLVGIPLLWGVFITLQKAALLFR